MADGRVPFGMTAGWQKLAPAGNDEFDTDSRSDLVTDHQPRRETETGYDR